MSIKVENGQKILAERYNKSVDQLPTYTRNKYGLVGDRLKNLLPDRNYPLRIVEFGCGNIDLARTYFFPRFAPERVVYVGLDDNPDLDPSPSVLGRIPTVPLADSCADAVLCLDVLEHLQSQDIGPAIAEISRVAKPKAPIIICVPSMYNLDRLCMPSIQFGTHSVKQTPREWLGEIEKFIATTHTEGIGVFEIVPFLPQFLYLINFPDKIIQMLYRALKSFDLGRLTQYYILPVLIVCLFLRSGVTAFS